MYVLNLTSSGRMISINAVKDITIRAKSLSVFFEPTPRVLDSLVRVKNYQNVFRFVMDPQEMAINTTILPEVIISKEEADEMVKKMEAGIDPFKKLDIHGKEIDEEKASKEDSQMSYDRNEVKVKLSDPKRMKFANVVNPQNQTLTFESSNPEVATVDATGKVKPHKVGKTTITATAAESDLVLQGVSSYELEVQK